MYLVNIIKFSKLIKLKCSEIDKLLEQPRYSTKMFR